MADGDVTSVKRLGSIVLPGGGNTTAGGQKQNKVLVWGQINCTYHSTGVDFASATGIYGAGGSVPLALGLDTIDFIEVVVGVNSTDDNIDKDNLTLVQLDATKKLLFMLENLGQNEANAPTNADTLDLRFWAIGDAHNADLT